MSRIIGIYKIVNLKNGKLYIGSTSNDFRERWWTHKSYLNNNKHDNKHLQNAWNKYGGQNFKFEIIEECKKEILREKEQYYIDQWYLDENGKFIKQRGYNIREKAESNEGVKHTEDVKRRIKKAISGENSCHAKLTQMQVNEVRNLYLSGAYLQKDLAKKYDVSSVTIGDIVRNKCYVDNNYEYERREFNKNKEYSKKVSNEDVKEIKRQYQLYKISHRCEGLNQYQLADKYNISVSHVNGIINNKKRKRFIS